MEGNELFHTGNIYVDNTLLILSFLAMVGFCLVMFIALFRIALGILLLFLGYAIYPFYVLYRLEAFLSLVSGNCSRGSSLQANGQDNDLSERKEKKKSRLIGNNRLTSRTIFIRFLA